MRDARGLLASCPAHTAALCVETADGSDALVAPRVDLGGIDLTTAKLAGVNGVNLVACPAALPDGWLCVAGSDGSSLVGPGVRLPGPRVLAMERAHRGGADVRGRG